MTTDPRAPKNATEATRAANAVLAARLPLDDDADFTRAERGLLRRAGDEETLPEEAPETVNPSLWRQARLNALHGLYEVTDGVYRVRGYDLANVTFIRGKRGWIVVDLLTAAKTAAAALRTLREHFADERPVTAVVYTHCHVDHFAGIRGVVTDEDIAADAVRLIGPEGFLEHAVAEELELPSSLADEFFLRDYYGTVNHNAKAVYRKYLGWFDANPAHLHPLPQVEAAQRYAAYMGGGDAVRARARADFAAGEYRWVAEVVNHLVFADPANEEARLLQADTLEQLGYQAEPGPWRGFYLTGIQELCRGTPNAPGLRTPLQPDVLRGMPGSMLLDYLAVRLDGPRAATRALRAGPAPHRRGHHAPRRTLPRHAAPRRSRRGRGHRSGRRRARSGHAGPGRRRSVTSDPAAGGRHRHRFGTGRKTLRELLKLLVAFDLFFPVIEP